MQLFSQTHPFNRPFNKRQEIVITSFLIKVLRTFKEKKKQHFAHQALFCSVLFFQLINLKGKIA